MEYSKEELELLHEHLYMITKEIIRICNKYTLNYFVIGGTAIGVYYWNAIIPWDDDIDIGMPREDYERFLQIAPNELDNNYFLQWTKTEPHTPFWFAKVRENNTLYIESHFKTIKMHHGIFVDIFPFDNIPNSIVLEKVQYHLFGFFNACFIGKEIWQWKHFGKCEVDVPLKRGFVPCLITRLVNIIISKNCLYKILCYIQTIYNGRGDYYKNIMTKSDKVRILDIQESQRLKFGPLIVAAPNHLKDYLLNHYGSITKYLPKEQQINHRPSCLEFKL